ncbi:STAS domain-containing protein [Gracilibacillus lacisalsi]|uniref:STAS domain-containing protein n=1 Tax=Gracilibacillus lacisalsi TaxID=393087 RepID=UPI000375EDD0|nr:STAS domain-containing protein [Gracilibacillus lacisalsi]
MLEYKMEKADDNCNVLLNGDLDIDSTELVNNELVPKLKYETHIYLNFEDVNFVDSSGMGLLIQLVNQLKDEKQLIRIVNVKEDILEVFDLLQIPEIIGENVIVK